MNTPAIFLDRDGTLNVDVGYPNSLDQIELIPGAIAAVRRFNKLGYKVIVVTNQSGVARGFLDEARVREINRGFTELFARQGARIDGIYYCPHHPEVGPPEYRQHCQCRKPEPGLFRQAARDHRIDLAASWIIGDKYSDVQAGKRLGMPAILVLTGAGRDHLRRYGNNPDYPQPDFIAEDISRAAELIPLL